MTKRIYFGGFEFRFFTRLEVIFFNHFDAENEISCLESVILLRTVLTFNNMFHAFYLFFRIICGTVNGRYVLSCHG